ncbi:hypothetical protein NSE01_34500 [Novosphingobium sediminis]|uniref:Uncharacterized protein n=1 Tax=Novosphingobium sediminis TaxID=707214 RepID=A0A512API3_9SPHN|nr:hypothetical protein NSE01_34500 [Novosphingobium sediminis]
MRVASKALGPLQAGAPPRCFAGFCDLAKAVISPVDRMFLQPPSSRVYVPGRFVVSTHYREEAQPLPAESKVRPGQAEFCHWHERTCQPARFHGSSGPAPHGDAAARSFGAGDVILSGSLGRCTANFV